MAYRIAHRAGPYTVRVKLGRPPLAHIGTYHWIEGPGMPEAPPTCAHDAWARHRHRDGDAIKALADQLATAYRAGREEASSREED